MEGRDDRRAERRFRELTTRDPPTLGVVKDQVAERDQRDSGRAIAPLLQAEDAEFLDSSDLGIEQVVERIVSSVQRTEAKLKASP